MSSNGIGKLALGLTLGCLAVTPAQALVLTAFNATPVSVDGDKATSTVNLPTGGTILDVSVELQFALSTGYYPGDIQFLLTKPNPADPANPVGSVLLIASDPQNGDQITTGGPLVLTFSDSGAERWGFLGDYSDTSNPYEPYESLKQAFNGKQALGDWILTIEDFTQDGLPLELTRFTLNVTVQDRNGVPAPATLALLGLGLAGMGALRRRRR